MTITTQPRPGLVGLASLLDLAERHALTAYDAAYLLLALEEGAALASFDGDLVKAARAEGLNVYSPF